MRQRWYYLKRTARENFILMPVLFVLAALIFSLWSGRHLIAKTFSEIYRTYGVQMGSEVMKRSFPALAQEEGERPFLERLAGGRILFSFLTDGKDGGQAAKDPAYERLLAKGWQEETKGAASAEKGTAEPTGEESGSQETDAETEADIGKIGEAIALKPPGSGIVLEKLTDYDYLMKSFYSVHPTTTAGRGMMNAEKFMDMDFSLEKDGGSPQILIYHTHSQEEFSDFPDNPEATIVGVGTYLAELLQQRGYGVIHDTGVYDLKDGKLDRSQAYTYALDGISGILQKNPSIEVVLDVHRDGVNSGTHLVTEVNGKPTAQIMFFNGLSQTPDGAIEYLPNPNREANLGFSFQLQLAASGSYPGFTRKIYLKGLRYNEHVRARAALIEVGAQTNTYDEARNAMEPLAEILDQVLRGGQGH